MQDRSSRYVRYLANFGYILTCLILFGIAIWIVGASAVTIVSEVIAGQLMIYHLLDEVALIVFAFAVIDVSKYLLLEEVLKGPGERRPKEARQALGKLVLIIFTALSLEGLVLTIEMAKTNTEMMIYSSVLIFVSTLFLVGLGVYQWLSSKAEKN